MTEHTQLIDAVNIRTAVRTYDDEPIDDDTARQLEMALQPINLLGDLNIQLVRNQPKVFEANASGHLTNAANYLAIVGPKNDEEARERAGRPNRMSSSPPRWAMKNVTQHQRGSRPASRLR